MRIKLRASGQGAIIPTPPKALRMGGDDTPVNSRRGFYDGSLQAGLVVGPPIVNIGNYIPPPKNPIWTPIPTTIVPTPLMGQQPFKKPCKGCK